MSAFEVKKDSATILFKDVPPTGKIAESISCEQFIDMTLALAWNQKENSRKAILFIAQTDLVEAYRDATPGLKSKIEAVEVIVRSHVREYDALLCRIQQIGRKSLPKLVLPNERREVVLLEIIANLIQSPDPKSDTELVAKIQHSLDLYTSQEVRGLERRVYQDRLTSKAS